MSRVNSIVTYDIANPKRLRKVFKARRFGPGLFFRPTALDETGRGLSVQSMG